MSGTSTDGLDICFARFYKENDQWRTRDLITHLVPYSDELVEELTEAFFGEPDEIKALDKKYARFIGDEVNKFIERNELFDDVDLIASHGHTIFHDPQNKITYQIGNGQLIANITQVPVVNDFRIKDVELGGQGAPLVPFGDAHLFSEYEACLNLGGFSNISFEMNQERIAYDICPCNLPINFLADHFFGLNYDQNGEIAASGELNQNLLRELNDLPYYVQIPPKSLGVEWLNTFFFPVVEKYMEEDGSNILHTIVYHATEQIAKVLNKNGIKNVLITGGGAYNQFLIEQLKEKTTCELIIPENEIVDYKEALIFGFLGLMNSMGEINTYKSVTGAKMDSIGGILHEPE